MKKIAIVYYSGSGHTHLMAEQIAAGVQSVASSTATLLRIEGKDIVEGRYKNEALVNSLTGFDAIVFGSPTYMGNIAAQLKAFIDTLGGHWYTKALQGKLAGGFTHSGSPAGDKGSTLAYLQVLANQLGLLWVGQGEHPYYLTGNKEEINRFSFSTGAAGQTPMGPQGTPAVLNAGDAATAKAYGVRLATLAQKLS